MTHRFSRQGALGLVLLAPALAAQAQPAPDTAGTTHSVEAHGSGDSTLQLFEFLGEFTTEDGEWLDPVILMEGDVMGSAQTGMAREGQETRRQDTDDDAARNENCVESRCEK